MDDFCLIILGGDVAQTLPEFARRARLILCADSGAEHARRLGLSCNMIVGDLNSISAETLHEYESRATRILRVLDQAHNDFEKVLDHLATSWSGDVLVVGMTGGRLDHTLSNLSAMLRYTDRFANLRAIDDFAEYRFLTDARMETSIECLVGATISLIPFGEARGIVTENLRFPLLTETLCMGVREGLSNSALASPVWISIESGALLIATSLVAALGD